MFRLPMTLKSLSFMNGGIQKKESTRYVFNSFYYKYTSLIIPKYRSDFMIYLIFIGKNSARLLWTKNLDYDDVYTSYPPSYDKPDQPGFLDGLNMSKLSRIQRSYRWQLHLPFFPKNLPSHPFAARYNYKYDTLPIIQTGPKHWTLDPSVSKTWISHVTFFSTLLSKWRGNLALAPMTITDLPYIRDYPLDRVFETEKKTRGYYWFARTLIFEMFAEFAFVAAGSPKWRTELTEMRREGHDPISEKWLDEVELALCDFEYTKRAGVIIDVAKTEIWPTLPRYHKNGVPTLMDVGYVEFHDHDDVPKQPTIYITPVCGHTRYDKYPNDWPSPYDILKRTETYLSKNFRNRLGITQIPPPKPLEVSRPIVEEPGEGFRERATTSAWYNEHTDQNVQFLQVTSLEPANPRRSVKGENWVEFFAERNAKNKRIEERETPAEKDRREQRAKDAMKINQVHSNGPTKKSVVYEWLPVTPPPNPSSIPLDGVPRMKDGWVPLWRRQKIDRKERDDVWDRYPPSQRWYDSFHNEWHLMLLLDVEAEIPDNDYDDSDDGMELDRPPIDPNQPVAYLDQLNVAPPSSAFETVQVLNSQIAFLAPSSLYAWAYATLGLRCLVLEKSSIKVPHLHEYMGFFLDDEARSTVVYAHLHEFVSYICARDFTNPRMAILSDLNPKHPSTLDVFGGGLFVNKVEVSRTDSLEDGEIGSSGFGYILTPKDEQSSYQHGWILVVFNATSVVQIIRNGWGNGSMEALVRHLVHHGIEFRTLVPSIDPKPSRIVKYSPELVDFNGLARISDIKVPRTVDNYLEYVALRDRLMDAREGKPAFRMGGILWRLAMESTANFDNVVDHIMDGPCEVGPTSGEYFQINGNRFYDDSLSPLVANTICGMHGENGGKFFI